MATPDAVPGEPSVRLRLNGEKRPYLDDDKLVFPVSRAIAEFSRFLTPERGDTVAMGTFVAVRLRRDGDCVEIEAKGVARVAHNVAG